MINLRSFNDKFAKIALTVLFSNQGCSQPFFPFKPKLYSTSRISNFANVPLPQKRKQQSTKFSCAKIFQSSALLITFQHFSCIRLKVIILFFKMKH